MSYIEFVNQLQKIVSEPNDSTDIINNINFQVFIKNENNYITMLNTNKNPLSQEAFYYLLFLFKKIVAYWDLGLKSDSKNESFQQMTRKIYNFNPSFRNDLTDTREYFFNKLKYSYLDFKQAINNLFNLNEKELTEDLEINVLKNPEIPLIIILKLFIKNCESIINSYDSLENLFPYIKNTIDFKSFAAKYNLSYPIIFEKNELKSYNLATTELNSEFRLFIKESPANIFEITPMKYKLEMLTTLKKLLDYMLDKEVEISNTANERPSDKYPNCNGLFQGTRGEKHDWTQVLPLGGGLFCPICNKFILYYSRPLTGYFPDNMFGGFSKQFDIVRFFPVYLAEKDRKFGFSVMFSLLEIKKLKLRDILRRIFVVMGNEIFDPDYFVKDLEVLINNEMIAPETDMMSYLPELEFGSKIFRLRGPKAELLHQKQKDLLVKYTQSQYDYWKWEEMDDEWIKETLDLTQEELEFYKSNSKENH